MSSPSTPVEPTRPLPMPIIDGRGNLHATTTLSPKQNTTRSRLPIPPEKVMPVILVPGIMGSNLRASAFGKNRRLEPGEDAWRPPNGIPGAIQEMRKWGARTPDIRQLILDADSLEVNPEGKVILPLNTSLYAWDEATVRERGWGEVHASSYGELLAYLQTRLNVTFGPAGGNSMLAGHWQYLNNFDRTKWNTTKTGYAAELSYDEMKVFSEFYYPVYAFGYNWLQSNAISATKLCTRINDVISHWKELSRKCDTVLLVTHSMGGLVARACAKKIPEKIAGVIHGVMPALGTPACYRRLACGTESSSPTNNFLTNIGSKGFSDIAGPDAASTTPVLAVSPGALELLPNHLYPQPWLFVEIKEPIFHRTDMVGLSFSNPYDFYGDFDVWYRPINWELVDPARLYGNLVLVRVRSAIDSAEAFHLNILGDYYHPKTFAFYGVDDGHATFGSCRWIVEDKEAAILPERIRAGTLRPDLETQSDERYVRLTDGALLKFKHSIQDEPGDGTVSRSSGAAPEGKILQTFRTKGFDHQGSCKNEAMMALTLQLIAKIVQKK